MQEIDLRVLQTRNGSWQLLTLQIADEKFYEHWKDNCPELRKVESRETNKHIVSEWGKQRERREQVQTSVACIVKCNIIILLYFAYTCIIQELETARQEKKMFV